ncbi:MAG TPA: hypothetical protein VFS20_24465 [Longimicrobium sp.]|nr:hypothetical protein [Longimicrobium sp.]
MFYDRGDLARLWREHAALLRRYGAEAQALVLEQCAEEIEAEMQADEARLLTLDEAVEFSGYTRGHLVRLDKAGKLRNVGTTSNPLYVRSELPRKPGQTGAIETLAQTQKSAVDLRNQAARAALYGEDENSP